MWKQTFFAISSSYLPVAGFPIYLKIDFFL